MSYGSMVHTCAISFMLIKKYSANFHESHTCPTALCTHLVPNFTPKRITDIESTHRNCALKTFNVYKTHTHSIFWTYPAPNSYLSLIKHVEKRATSS